MQSCSCCMSEKVFYLVFDMFFFLGIEFWVKYISLSILRCGASVLWLTLSHMLNLLSFPCLFNCVCFSFWLHFFGWLFETMNYHAPLNSCPISCPLINWTSVLMGLKLSSYLENFQPGIMKFFSLFSFFHFLWDSIYIYFSILKVVSNLSDAQLIFPTVFSFLFSMSLFNILTILQLHDSKDYYSRKHFNVLPC